jgi:hypothetical protein
MSRILQVVLVGYMASPPLFQYLHFHANSGGGRVLAPGAQVLPGRGRRSIGATGRPAVRSPPGRHTVTATGGNDCVADPVRQPGAEVGDEAGDRQVTTGQTMTRTPGWASCWADPPGRGQVGMVPGDGALGPGATCELILLTDC